MKTAEEILNTEMELYNNKGGNYLPLPEMFKVRFSDSEKEFIHKAMDIHADQFKPKWIRVKDELPEINRLCIVSRFPCDQQSMMSASRLDDDNFIRFGYMLGNRFHELTNITHWFYAPEKPE